MKIFLLLSLTFLFLIAFDSHAQKYHRNKRYTSVGGNLNALNYFGDITPTSAFTSTDLRFTRPNLSFHVMRRITPRLSIRGAMSWGRLAGDDAKSANAADVNGRYRYLRNAHFRNDIKELSMVGIWDYFENRNTFLRRPDFVPYAFAGLALFHHNPKAKTPEALGGHYVALQPLGTEGQHSPLARQNDYPKPYHRLQVAIPAGIGFRYKVSAKVDFSFEIGYRFTFTDYLDDVSGNYPDMDDLGSDLARTLSNRTLEKVSARTGADRSVMVTRISEDTGLKPLFYKGREGNIYQTMNGFGRQGDMRGKRNEKDWYVVTGFSVSYLLIQGVRCPKFK